MTETTFYTDDQGVRVTNARLMIGNTTYSMANISSVKRTRTDPSYGGPLLLFLFGLLFVGLAAAQGGNAIGPCLFLAVLSFGGGGLWFYGLKPTYYLSIQSSSGSTSALDSRNHEWIDKIVQAINEAMISRG